MTVVCFPGEKDDWHFQKVPVCYTFLLMEKMTDSEPEKRDLPDLSQDVVHQGDEFWMRKALAQAHLAYEEGEVPVGAVAVHNGQIIGAGFNRKESEQDPTAHAEIIALRQAARNLNNWRLIGVTLYCTLEPCPMCAGAMIQGRLQRLVYGAPDTRFGADGTVVEVLREPAFNHRVDVTPGVLASEAGELLQQFFRLLRGEQTGE